MSSGPVDHESVRGGSFFLDGIGWDTRDKNAIIDGFKDWLILQNYAKTTVRYAPRRVTNFLDWCVSNGIKSNHAKIYFAHLQGKKNSRNGGLSQSTLRTYITTLRQFRRYLREVGGVDFEVDIIHRSTQVVDHYEIFTRAEIKRLYHATDEDLLGMRDRAMLAIYYGCGLRRNEGVSMDVHDILPDKNLIYIRRGKGNKQRYVPIVGKTRQDILEYLTIARSGLLQNAYEVSFFIGIQGRPLSGNQIYERLKRLMRIAGIDKACGLHSLRHSIATHLLDGGMALEQISKLLGHASLDTTQIYVHLLEELGYDKG